MDTVQKNLDMISGLFGVTDPVYAWCYEENGQLVASNCPEEHALNAAFDLVMCKYRMLEHYQESNAPYIAGLPFGLIWLTAITTREGVRRIYALGPVFSSHVSSSQIHQGLFHCVDKTPGIISITELSSAIETLPVFPSNLLQRYVLMLHFLLNGEQLQFSDVSINNKLDPVGAKKWLQNKDRHKTWLTEQAMMQAVREGNLNYRQVLANARNISNGVPVSSPLDPLRSGKTSATVFASLCTRAAIEGGLLPDEAYSVGDSYIQRAENCTSYDEIMSCTHDMYLDFIQRVHRRKVSPNLSPTIQRCCDHINFYIDKKLRIRDLAEQFGYSEFYLSRKFKQETGKTINHYIRDAKIARAQTLLTTTDMTIDAISEQLNFSSRGYFGEVFLQVTGTTPASYRQENQKA